MSDQDRISPYDINTISRGQVMRIEKILIRINSPNYQKNYMTDSKENY